LSGTSGATTVRDLSHDVPRESVASHSSMDALDAWYDFANVLATSLSASLVLGLAVHRDHPVVVPGLHRDHRGARLEVARIRQLRTRHGGGHFIMGMGHGHAAASSSSKRPDLGGSDWNGRIRAARGSLGLRRTSRRPPLWNRLVSATRLDDAGGGRGASRTAPLPGCSCEHLSRSSSPSGIGRRLDSNGTMRIQAR